MVEEALDDPAIIDSYVNAYARALLFDGSFAGRELLVFSVGMSLGAAVVVEGRIQRGFNGSAGGFAHSRAHHWTRPRQAVPLRGGGLL
jgi:predicted NBD/HSP70 family sugar kinase